jgi:hypothetical protein
MTHNEARELILTTFRAGWNDTTYSVAYDNMVFDPPIGTTMWARVMIEFFQGKQASIGSTNNRLFRRLGMVTIHVCTPMGDATYNNDINCQTVLNLFEGKNVSGLRFEESTIETIGEDEAGKWYVQAVKTYFRFEQVK